MARVRHIKIENFRCIKDLIWMPGEGINCLIGPGDAGKSSILDALDFCLVARRALSFTDADFHNLDVSRPIRITVTVGDLDDSLKSLETYGSYLRGYHAATGLIEDEPEAGAETVLSICLTVNSDLDPVWTLLSDRAEATGQKRFLTWSDRARLSPTRVGALADHHLAWRRGSILNRLSDEKPDMAAALADAARNARVAFGDIADAQFRETLQIVTQTAGELGISLDGELKAMLDAHAISFNGGTIALHGANGVPLRALGVGSTRLLLAGLQRKAAKDASVIMIDELEHGLEPHRIMRLLGSIGAKENPPPLQAFITTHSPVAVRELRGDQLYVVRKEGDQHEVRSVGTDDEIQGTIRLYPEAFLAKSVIICEGASEVGLLRGLDQHRAASGQTCLSASGVSFVDAKGVNQLYNRARAFEALGYRVAVLRDDDVSPDAIAEAIFLGRGNAVFKWRAGCALEDELFLASSDQTVVALLVRAISLFDQSTIEAHIRTASVNQAGLDQCVIPINPIVRPWLGLAARSKSNAWFKSVSKMESVANDVIFPNLATADRQFNGVISAIESWAHQDA
ncbi:AAA family ATPase [Asticcacaulis sp. BYS171W]|uniref:AAA family ATPase n=1 Tax=Asticcacaulis aquaticus TaxID=2984212 RepID=A0ABT5HXS6_9CAUL|nr:AAA family ATPase [Asticcacaulis aquaticus]MDC7684880.1 AAA family ATPase [Asticcacaulis aquaticus]